MDYELSPTLVHDGFAVFMDKNRSKESYEEITYMSDDCMVSFKIRANPYFVDICDDGALELTLFDIIVVSSVQHHTGTILKQFLNQVHATRDEMLEAIQSLSPNFLAVCIGEVGVGENDDDVDEYDADDPDILLFVEMKEMLSQSGWVVCVMPYLSLIHISEPTRQP
jgi:hypothetical protein